MSELINKTDKSWKQQKDTKKNQSKNNAYSDQIITRQSSWPCHSPTYFSLVDVAL
jgi:hypothetical protein